MTRQSHLAHLFLMQEGLQERAAPTERRVQSRLFLNEEEALAMWRVFTWNVPAAGRCAHFHDIPSQPGASPESGCTWLPTLVLQFHGK